MTTEHQTTTEKASNGNGKSYSNEDAWTTWPGAAKACKILGVSMRALRDMVEWGAIQAHHGSDGTLRFRKEWLEEYIEDQKEIPEDEVFDAKKSDKAASREGIPADAIRATAELLRSSQHQNLELHQLVLKGFKAATEAQDITIQRLLERNAQYETIITDLLKTREAYYDAQLEREVLRNQQAAAQKRRDELFQVSKGWAGELVEGLKQRYGLTPEANSKVSAAIELLQALSPDQIEVGATMGFFSAEQIVLIEKILGRKISGPGPQGEAQEASNTGTPGAVDSSSAAPGNDASADPSTAGAAANAAPAANDTETKGPTP